MEKRILWSKFLPTLWNFKSFSKFLQKWLELWLREAFNCRIDWIIDNSISNSKWASNFSASALKSLKIYILLKCSNTITSTFWNFYLFKWLNRRVHTKRKKFLLDHATSRGWSLEFKKRKSTIFEHELSLLSRAPSR